MTNPDASRATEIYQRINRQTLGQLLKNVGRSTDTLDHLGELLDRALKARNRLSHTFYMRHNFRRNSDEGRQIMLDDLHKIHGTIFDAYKGVLRLSGVDLDAIDYDSIDLERLPNQHFAALAFCPITCWTIAMNVLLNTLAAHQLDKSDRPAN